MSPALNRLLQVIAAASAGALSVAAIGYAQNLYVEGKIGVGTEAPAAKLDVRGDMVVAGTLGVGSTAPAATLDVSGTARLRGAGSGTGLTVDAGGQVGIGTTTPAAGLDVVGSLRFDSHTFTRVRYLNIGEDSFSAPSATSYSTWRNNPDTCDGNRDAASACSPAVAGTCTDRYPVLVGNCDDNGGCYWTYYVRTATCVRSAVLSN